jgi:formylglycine-generating enzyme required for sulfatase activity
VILVLAIPVETFCLIGATDSATNERAVQKLATNAAIRNTPAIIHCLTTLTALPPQDERNSQNRELRILAAADQTFQRKHPDWKGRIQELVSGASKYYEDFGLRFVVVDCQTWVLKADATVFPDTWKQLYGIDPAGADLVIGFIGVKYPQEHMFGGYRLGQAMHFSQHAYISDDSSLELGVTTLAHELGHIFGAFHVADARSIMYPDANRMAKRLEFGKTNREVIGLTKNVDFQRGVETLPPEASKRIKELHATYHHPSESSTGNPLAMGYIYRALRADAIGDQRKAKAMATHAIEWSPDLPLAYAIVGSVATRSGNVVIAEQAFRQLTKLDANSALGWVGLANALLDMADAEPAGVAAERACELAPRFTMALRARAFAEYYTGKESAFQRDLEQLKKAAPLVASDVENHVRGESVQQMATEHEIRNAAARVTTTKNSIGMHFVQIRPQAAEDQGQFQMGSVPDERGRSHAEQRHSVRLTRDYYLGQTEVTQGQFEQIMGYNPSHFQHDDPEMPVENVTWDEAVQFCQRLSEVPQERENQRDYRLPTEAEWEYGCRAGCAEKYYFGAEDRSLRDYAWISVRSTDIGTHPVGQKAPNRWGLCDMLGNVAEWCSDWFADFPDEEQADPIGPPDGTKRVIRGGPWSLNEGPPRSATRTILTFQEKSHTTGFRVVFVPRREK